MKKKIFSSLLLVAFALVSMSTFVSCKDYDDDINANATAITSLQEQLKTLQAALDQAKAEAQTAHGQFVTQTELGNAKAAVEAAAKEAAATAKAEAIAEAVEQCKALVAGKANQSDLDALATKVTSIDEALNKLPKNIATVDYVDAAVKNLTDQVKALEYLKTLIPENTTLIKDVENLQKDLKAAQDEISKKANKADVDAAIKEVKDEMAKANKKVDELTTKVNVLTVLVDKALTSVTLIPQLYIGGIETIELKNIVYTPMHVVDGAWTYASSLDEVQIDSIPALAKYQLNPTSVSAENIAGVDIVSNIAVTRADEKHILAVGGYKLDAGGVMTVELNHFFPKDENGNRNIVDSFYLGTQKAYIAALKVARFNSDNSTTDVYSEYSRVVATKATPMIAHLIKGKYECETSHDHFNDSVSVYQSTPGDEGWPVKDDLKLDYTKSYDLLDYVTGCAYNYNTSLSQNDRYFEMDKAELARYGMEFKFYVASKEYLDTNTPTGEGNKFVNEQDFAEIQDGHILVSKVPEIDGSSNNAACVGKSPIIRVELVDVVRNNVVDVKYIKVLWSEGRDVAILNTSVEKETILNACDMNTALTWNDILRIYSKGAKAADGSKLDLASISEAEFRAVYLSGQRPTIKGINFEEQYSYIWSTPQWTHAGTDYIAWLNLADEFNYGKLKDLEIVPEKSKTLVAEITFHSASANRPDLVLTWSVKVTVDPSITRAGDNAFWKDDVIIVTPLTLSEAVAKGYPTVAYEHDLMGHFVWDSNYDDDGNLQVVSLIKGMWYPCPESNKYDVQFDSNQSVTATDPDGDIRSYTAQFNDINYKDGDPYKNYDNKQHNLYMLNKKASRFGVPFEGSYDDKPAVALEWLTNAGGMYVAMDGNWSSFSNFIPVVNIRNRAEGYEFASLLNKFEEGFTVGSVKYKNSITNTLNLTVWARYNDKNIAPAGTFKVAFIEPIDIIKNFTETKFQLANHEMEHLDVAIKAGYDIVDFLGEQVGKYDTQANGTTANKKHMHDLYEYYKVENPVYGLSDDDIIFCYTPGTTSVDNNINPNKGDRGMTLAEVKRTMPDKWGNFQFWFDDNQYPTKASAKNFNSYTLTSDVKFYVPVTIRYVYGEFKIYYPFVIQKAPSQSAKKN